MRYKYIFFKEELKMILFTILLITLLILLVATVIGIGCIGSVGIIIFGDVIICIFLIGWILKHLVKKKCKK